jgi:hypothetical protein
MDDLVFDLPYFAENVGQPVSLKFQAFNIWGNALQDPADCNVYTFTPLPLGARAPGSAAWTALGATLSNAGVSSPAILITGTSDNLNATAVLFYFRQTGQVSWQSAGQHAITTTAYYIANVASSQSYDVGVAYLVNGIIGTIQVIATNVTAGASSSGGSAAPGSTLFNSSATGASGTMTLPAGSYTHIDVVLTGIGGQGYSTTGKGGGTQHGASGASVSVLISVSVTPAVTTCSWNLSAVQGTASTFTIGATTLSCPSGINGTSGGPGAAPSNATGGTNNFQGHAGGITYAASGGGAWIPTNPAANVTTGGYTDQNTANQPGTVPGGGSAGIGPPGGANVLVIAR